MVRICRRVSAFAAVATVLLATSTAPSSVRASGGISLELHRMPDTGKRHETYQRRRLLNEADGYEALPLHPGMGTHYTWVYAGTPPQRASVITDTGSSLMAFPCSGCNGCGTHTDEPFEALKSSTLTHVTCNDPSFFRCQGCASAADPSAQTCAISQSYMEGSSWHATVVEDFVYLGGESSANDTSLRTSYGTHFKFGCQSSETGLFITQVADGIMGLANNDNHIVAKLYREKKIPNKLFSLCFAPQGGAMSIGVPDTTRHKGNITYAKLKPTSGHAFYGVELRDVLIAGKSIEPSPTSLQFGQVIVDSGTTDSYLPRAMKTKFEEAFKKISGMDYQTSSASCLGYTDKDLEKLPNIELILGADGGGNLTLVVTPSQYLLREESGKYCSSVFLSEGSGGVIGANIMMDRDVIFDQSNQRVGFVEADCAYRRLSAQESSNLTSSSTNMSSSPTPPVATVASNTTAPAATVAVESATPVSTSDAGNASTSSPPSAAPTEEPSSNQTSSTSPSSMTPQPETTSESTLAPTQAPTQAPTLAPTEAPTQAPTQAPTEAPTNAPTEASTEAPTETSTPTTSKPPATETPTPTTTSVPAKRTPEPTTAATVVSDAGVNAALNASMTGDEHPAVLTIVGTGLAVAFIVVAAYSLRRRTKKKSGDQKWRRVNETEGDVDDDDDDEEELIIHTAGTGKGKHQKLPGRSDDLDEDDNDGDDDDDNRSDDDDDDEIFDQEVDGQDEHNHDARVLERL